MQDFWLLSLDNVVMYNHCKKKSRRGYLRKENDVEALKLDLEAQYQAKMDKLSMDNEKALKTQITSLERHYKAKEKRGL